MQINPELRGKPTRVPPAAPFLSPDGRFRGWKVQIPGARTLATPAVMDGRVFLGGGFGSYDFYAFDAVDGSVAWQYQTSDDGWLMWGADAAHNGRID
jgi:outer membrane protein assembly factor BamB